MKKSKILLGMIAVGLFALNACNDEGTILPGEGGSNATDCKIDKITYDDGEVISYTYDGDNLVKISESDSFGSTEILFNYVGGQLDEIIEDDDTYKLTRTDGKVSRVELLYLGHEETRWDLEYNADGKVSKITVYEFDMGTPVLWESYSYTWSGDNPSQVLNDYDSDGDGVLDDKITYELKSFDDKRSPYAGTAAIYSELDNPLNFAANNLLNGSVESVLGSDAISFTYEYNEHNYPTKIIGTIFGFTSISNVSYICE